jgi:ParB/RepB/Spo0J family partition protein
VTSATLEAAPSKIFIEDFDPKQLIRTRNVRPVELTAEFIGSIRENGVAQPVITAPHPDGGYAIILGNRRTAGAIEVGRTVDIVVRHDLDGEATRIILQLVENIHREEMKTSEIAAAYAQLALDLGLSDEEIAQRVARDRKDVREAIALHGMPKVARDAADTGALSVEDAIALQEFESDPKVYRRLLDKIENGGNFSYSIHEARRNKAKKEKKAELRAELDAAGVMVIGEPKEFGWGGSKEAGLERLTDKDGETFTVESHASCPGHASFIRSSTYGDPSVHYLCRDPKGYGHTVSGSYRHRTPDEVAAEEEARHKEAERREALTVAAEVRAEFVAGLCRAKKVPKGLMRYCLETVFAYGVADGRERDAMTLGFLGVREVDEDPQATFGRKLSRFAEVRQPLVLLAIVANKAEINMANHAAGRTWGCNDAFAIGWLEFLSAQGYALSEPEVALVETLRAREAERAARAAREDDEDDEDWDDEDEEADDACAPAGDPESIAEQDGIAPDEHDEQGFGPVSEYSAVNDEAAEDERPEGAADEAEPVQVPDDLSTLTHLTA